MPAHDQLGVLRYIRQEFQGLGYVGNLLQENYAYADVLASDMLFAKFLSLYLLRTLPRTRPHPLGVAVTNGKSGVE